jgi:hypothetical protein
VENLDSRLVGVSFEITGMFPDELKLQLPELDRQSDTFFQLTTGSRADYFVVNAQLPEQNPVPLNTADLHLIQFEMRNATDAPLPADFCVEGVQLLVTQ